MMILLKVSFPPQSFKQVVQAFTSPDIPKRPESIKELASVGYDDEGGSHAAFVFDVPDAEVASFFILQSRRSAFISARAPGFVYRVHAGQRVADSIKTLMPMHA